jgi:hypothetical protein
MSNLRHFVLIEAIVLLSLFAIAVAMAAFAAIQSLIFESSLLSPASSAKMAFAYTLAFGIVPALLLGGPGYFALWRFGKGRWFYALLAGVLPGIVLVPMEPSLASWVALCGGAVALITHGLHRKWGPNISLKRTNQSLRD